jgi:hypothetical protein
MRDATQDGLDLGTDMILVKGSRGLLEKSLEDARETEGHKAHRNALLSNANIS